MAWRIYKEGQGKWLRGTMAGLIFIAAVIGVLNLHHILGRMVQNPKFAIPFINWMMDWRLLIEAPILILVLGWGVMLYNKPKVVDFLIDTENELKNRVTWPQKKEEVNASVVVVITVLIMMLFIFGVDSLFSFVKNLIYRS